jgi:hypothetical protein
MKPRPDGLVAIEFFALLSTTQSCIHHENIRYPLSAVRYPLSAIRYPLSAIRYLRQTIFTSDTFCHLGDTFCHAI